MTHLKRLYHVHEIHQLMSNRKRAPFVSLTLMSRWRNILGLNVPVGSFLHKYPPCSTCSSSGRNTCCRVTKRMEELILLEGVVVRQQEMEAVKRVKKLLMMSVSVTLRLHALRMIRRELGLPEDFRDCILGKFSGDFKLVGLEVVELVDWDADLGLARLENGGRESTQRSGLVSLRPSLHFPLVSQLGLRLREVEELAGFHTLSLMGGRRLLG